MGVQLVPLLESKRRFRSTGHRTARAVFAILAGKSCSMAGMHYVRLGLRLVSRSLPVPSLGLRSANGNYRNQR